MPLLHTRRGPRNGGGTGCLRRSCRRCLRLLCRGSMRGGQPGGLFCCSLSQLQRRLGPHSLRLGLSQFHCGGGLGHCANRSFGFSSSSSLRCGRLRIGPPHGRPGALFGHRASFRYLRLCLSACSRLSGLPPSSFCLLLLPPQLCLGSCALLRSLRLDWAAFCLRRDPRFLCRSLRPDFSAASVIAASSSRLAFSLIAAALASASRRSCSRAAARSSSARIDMSCLPRVSCAATLFDRRAAIIAPSSSVALMPCSDGRPMACRAVRGRTRYLRLSGDSDWAAVVATLAEADGRTRPACAASSTPWILRGRRGGLQGARASA